MAGSETDRVLEKLAKDVEAAVHALYRGEVRQQTAKARTGNFVREAQQAMTAAMKAAGAEPLMPPVPAGAVASPRASASAVTTVGGAAGWSMRELTPTWGQRERAREAVRRISQP